MYIYKKIYSYLKESLQQEEGEEEKTEILSLSIYISLFFSLSLFGERKFIQAFFQDWNRCCSK